MRGSLVRAPSGDLGPRSLGAGWVGAAGFPLCAVPEPQPGWGEHPRAWRGSGGYRVYLGRALKSPGQLGSRGRAELHKLGGGALCNG